MKQTSSSITTGEKLSIYLEKAITIDVAQKGNIQLYDKWSQTLTLAAQQGFGSGFLNHFKVVKAFDSSACGRAIGIGSAVVISDIELDEGFKAHLSVAREEGFKAVKSIPLITSSGKYVGVLSTHFKEVRWDWEIKKLNDLSKELADFIDEQVI